VTPPTVLEDPAEVAEADGGVDALGHRRRLKAGGLTSAGERIVQVPGGQGGAEPAPPRVLQRAEGVDPAIAGEVEGHRGGDVLAVQAGDQDMVGGRVGTAEEVRRHAEDTQVLQPVRWGELDPRPGQAEVVEGHAHGPRRLVESVATPFQVATHRLVTLVHPGGKAGDAGRRVDRLHRLEGAGALGGPEVALQQRVVVDGALGLAGEDGGGTPREAPHGRAGRPTRVLLPGAEQGPRPTQVEVGVGHQTDSATNPPRTRPSQ